MFLAFAAVSAVDGEAFDDDAFAEASEVRLDARSEKSEAAESFEEEARESELELFVDEALSALR